MIKVYTAEFLCGRKPVIKGFTQKKAMTEWARERIADEQVSAISLWEMTTPLPAAEVLAVAAEGKDWYDTRICFLVITRKTMRVSK